VAWQVFVVGALTSGICLGLSQTPDPSIFGIRSEPSRILFYGLSGLLAAAGGLAALVSGLFLALQRSSLPSRPGSKPVAAILVVLLTAAVGFLALRLLS
jgi:hypothetical protein